VKVGFPARSGRTGAERVGLLSAKSRHTRRLGSWDHKLIEDEALSRLSNFLTHINALPPRTGMIEGLLK
jgi:hypothetical protein